MRKFLMSMVAVALCTSVAVAGEQAAAGKSCPAKKAGKCTISGTVESVDAAANKIVVKDKKGEAKDVVCAAGTKITVGSKAATLADVAVGDSVTVKMTGDAVKSVKVKKPKAKKEKKDAAPPAAPAKK